MCDSIMTQLQFYVRRVHSAFVFPTELRREVRWSQTGIGINYESVLRVSPVRDTSYERPRLQVGQIVVVYVDSVEFRHVRRIAEDAQTDRLDAVVRQYDATQFVESVEDPVLNFRKSVMI